MSAPYAVCMSCGGDMLANYWLGFSTYLWQCLSDYFRYHQMCSISGVKSSKPLKMHYFQSFKVSQSSFRAFKLSPYHNIMLDNFSLSHFQILKLSHIHNVTHLIIKFSNFNTVFSNHFTVSLPSLA